MLGRRRLMMFKKNRTLPPSVTEVDWILSTGSQYIDTERKVGDKDEIRIIAFTYESNPGACFGWKNDAENGCSFYNHRLFLGNEIYDLGITEFSLLYLNIDFKNSVFHTSLDEVPFNKELAFDENGRSWENMCLFARNSDGVLSYGKWAIWEYIHKNEHGGIIQHLVPVLDEEGKPCMYDLVSRKCFYNANKDSTDDFEYETDLL